MALVKKFIEENGFEALITTYKIHIGHHPTLPLMVLNYDEMEPKRFDPIVRQLRGLVLEKDKWTPMATGMTRFYNAHEVEGKNEPLQGIIRAEHKEDGTLMHLFNYQNQWILATRYNFSEDFLPSGLTFQEVFDSIIKPSSLNLLDPTVTYCLELCTLHNKIIRLYPNPEVYLLTGFRDGTELEIDDLDQIAPLVGFCRPKHLFVDTIPEAKALLIEYSKTDPVFEGFVLRDSNNNRLKLKNDTYRVIHKLKFRGWVMAKPDVVGPFILNKTIDYVIKTLSEYKVSYEMDEYIKRINYITDKLDLAYSDTKTIVEKYYESEIKDCIDNLKVYKFTGMLIDIIRRCNKDKSKIVPVMNEIWYGYGNQILAELFDDWSDPFIDHTHSDAYCKMESVPTTTESGMSTIKPTKSSEKIGDWAITCVCGSSMKLQRLRSDLIQYRTCHCEKIFGLHTYRTGMLIWRCTNLSCQLTHDAYQENDFSTMGYPTGIPASSRCKNLRLYCHQLLSQWTKVKHYNKNQSYKNLSKLVGISREQCHMALFDIDMCHKVIMALQTELGI
jgi:hypothetical protein